MTISGLTRLFLRRAGGATSVEFGLIALPFIVTLVAAFVIGLNAYMSISLDFATRKASRDLMTGVAQTGGYTASQFRDNICNYLPLAFTCANVFVNVTTMTSPAYTSTLAAPYRTPYYSYLNASQSGLTPPLLNASGNTFATSGAVGSCWLMVVQVAYPASALLSWLTPGGAVTYNGAKVNLLTSGATFLTEPYPATAGAATSGC
jgi:Flp pilus assembly protein TadG